MLQEDNNAVKAPEVNNTPPLKPAVFKKSLLLMVSMKPPLADWAVMERFQKIEPYMTPGTPHCLPLKTR